MKFLEYYFNTINNKSSLHPFNIFLFFLSLLYLFFYYIKMILYKLGFLRVYEADALVISVGNLTVGGTGKTPVVMELAKSLGKYKDVAVITRGYKRKGKDIEIVEKGLDAQLDVLKIGDEPYMIKKRLPEVILGVGACRAKVIEKILEDKKVDYFVLDDGFGKVSIKRYHDILLVDATNPFGNFFMLPRGILREPLYAINRADTIIITKANLVSAEKVDELCGRLKRYNKKIIISKYLPGYFVDFGTQKKVELKELKDKKVGLLAGIANPGSFKEVVKDIVCVDRTFFFSDHHWYTEDDIKKILEESEYIVTTEKDAVRLEEYRGLLEDKKVYVLIMEVLLDSDIVIYSKNEEKEGLLLYKENPEVVLETDNS